MTTKNHIKGFNVLIIPFNLSYYVSLAYKMSVISVLMGDVCDNTKYSSYLHTRGKIFNLCSLIFFNFSSFHFFKTTIIFS